MSRGHNPLVKSKLLTPQVGSLTFYLRSPLFLPILSAPSLPHFIFTPPPVGGRGIVFGRFLCFFVSLFLRFFVSNITRKRLDRFA